MLADFFTKPLQGALFRKFRSVLLGYSHINTLKGSPVQPTEERVEKENDNNDVTSSPTSWADIARIKPNNAVGLKPNVTGTTPLPKPMKLAEPNIKKVTNDPGSPLHGNTFS